MRNTKIALAVLALVASTAAMADVKVGGSFDFGYGSAKSGTNAVNTIGGDFNGLSNISISGSEELEGGMKAGFNLVNTVNAGAAQASAAGDGTGVIAQNVTLSGDFGGFMIGRGAIASFNATCATDPAGCSNTGSAVSFITAFRAGGANRVAANVFESNLLQYSTPNVGGFSGQAGYVFGSNTTSATNSFGDKYALGATYANGPITVSASHYEQKSTTASFTEQKNNTIGVAYDLGMATVKANYLKFNDPNSAAGTISDVKVMGFGVDTKLAERLSLNVSYYDASTNTSTTDATVTRGGLTYSLSKNTSLYLNHVQAKNKGGRVADAYGGLARAMGTVGDGAAGVNSTITALGVVHNF